MKTKTLDCTRRPEHAAPHRCTASESSGSGAECGMSHRICQKRIPIRALGEPKIKGSGTARVVAKSNHDGLLNPNRCWDSVRTMSVGRPMRIFGISRHSRREVRRQRMGRVGQSSSSESNSSCGVLAGFPTGMHRAETCRAKLVRLNKPAIELRLEIQTESVVVSVTYTHAPNGAMSFSS